MRIYELFPIIKFKIVWFEFIKFYGTYDEGKHITEESKEVYKSIYNNLSKMKPKSLNDEVISITEISEFNNSYVDIYGLFPDEPDTKYAIDLMEWDEVISMEYYPGQNLEGVTYSNEEFMQYYYMKLHSMVLIKTQ